MVILKSFKLRRIHVDHHRILKVICLCGVVIFMLPLCLGTGCSMGHLKTTEEPGKRWTCDKEADEVMMRNDYKSGILLHKRLLEKEPKNALALYHLGYAYGQIGEHLREVSCYEEAIALGFKTDRILFNLGMAYGELHQTGKSIGAFKEALTINPDRADSHFGLGMAYQANGADKLSEEAFLKAIRIEPEHVDARLSLSVLYDDWGEKQKAARQLHKILEIDPTNAKAREFLERIEGGAIEDNAAP